MSNLKGTGPRTRSRRRQRTKQGLFSFLMMMMVIDKSQNYMRSRLLCVGVISCVSLLQLRLVDMTTSSLSYSTSFKMSISSLLTNTGSADHGVTRDGIGGESGCHYGASCVKPLDCFP